MLNVPLLVKILVPIIVPYLAFLMRFICCRCYKNMFDDLKFAPSEEQFTMQKTIITTEMDPEEYLKTVRESITVKKPILWIDIIKTLIGIGLFVCAYYGRNLIYVYPDCAFFGSYLFISGFTGLFQCIRNIKYKVKAIFKKHAFTVFKLCLDIFYIPILTYFLQMMLFTHVQCPAGYFWGASKADYLAKGQGYCMPCANTLEGRYPGYSGFFNNNNNYTQSHYDEFKSRNPGIYNEKIYTINKTTARISEYCTMMYSGNPIRVLRSDNAIYFDIEILQNNLLFLFWAIQFIMIGTPVLYFLFIYRARKQPKTIAAYGETEEYRWHVLMNRVETVGAKYCKDLTENNAYWSCVKIIYKFFVLLVTTFAEFSHKSIIICLPMHILMLVTTLIRKPYFSFLNNLIDMILYGINAFVGFMAFIIVYATIPPKVNSGFVVTADIIGVAATIGVMIANILDKKKLVDPTRLTDNDEKRLKLQKEKENAEKKKKEGKEKDNKDKKGKKKKDNGKKKNSKRRHPNKKADDLLDYSDYDEYDENDNTKSKRKRGSEDDMSDLSESEEKMQEKSESLDDKKKKDLSDNVNEDELSDLENVQESDYYESEKDESKSDKDKKKPEKIKDKKKSTTDEESEKDKDKNISKSDEESEKDKDKKKSKKKDEKESKSEKDGKKSKKDKKNKKDSLEDDPDVGPIQISKDLIKSIDGTHDILDEDINMERMVLRQRFNLLYQVYDLMINDVEFSILARFLRFMCIIGIIVALPFFFNDSFQDNNCQIFNFDYNKVYLPFSPDTHEEDKFDIFDTLR